MKLNASLPVLSALKKIIFIVLSVALFSSCGSKDIANSNFQIVAEYPHDDRAFTQGFEFYEGNLIESTGLKGQSSLRVVDPKSGKVITNHKIDDDYFAEGLTIYNDLAYQLTWQDETLIVSDLNSGDVEKTYIYEGEGWGLCHDGDQFIKSDGSSQLTFHDSETFNETSKIDITANGKNISNLNELECVSGHVWANEYQTNLIHKIDPSNGKVVATVDLTSLVPEEYKNSQQSVLNGIAYNAGQDTYWVTGKNWPKVYEIKIE